MVWWKAGAEKRQGKLAHPKKKVLFQPSFSRDHVNFRGCTGGVYIYGQRMYRHDMTYCLANFRCRSFFASSEKMAWFLLSIWRCGREKLSQFTGLVACLVFGGESLFWWAKSCESKPYICHDIFGAIYIYIYNYSEIIAILWTGARQVLGMNMDERKVTLPSIRYSIGTVWNSMKGLRNMWLVYLHVRGQHVPGTFRIEEFWPQLCVSIHILTW